MFYGVFFYFFTAYIDFPFIKYGFDNTSNGFYKESIWLS